MATQYIDDAPNIVEHERKFKRFMRNRELERRFRQAQREDLRKRLVRELEAAKVRPFYSAEWGS